MDASGRDGFRQRGAAERRYGVAVALSGSPAGHPSGRIGHHSASKRRATAQRTTSAAAVMRLDAGRRGRRSGSRHDRDQPRRPSARHPVARGTCRVARLAWRIRQSALEGARRAAKQLDLDNGASAPAITPFANLAALDDHSEVTLQSTVGEISSIAPTAALRRRSASRMRPEHRVLYEVYNRLMARGLKAGSAVGLQAYCTSILRLPLLVRRSVRADVTGPPSDWREWRRTSSTPLPTAAGRARVPLAAQARTYGRAVGVDLGDWVDRDRSGANRHRELRTIRRTAG